MATDTHLLNMVRQILDAQDKNDPAEAARIHCEAVKHVRTSGNGGPLSLAAADHDVRRAVAFFTKGN